MSSNDPHDEPYRTAVPNGEIETIHDSFDREAWQILDSFDIYNGKVSLQARIASALRETAARYYQMQPKPAIDETSLKREAQTSDP